MSILSVTRRALAGGESIKLGPGHHAIYVVAGDGRLAGDALRDGAYGMAGDVVSAAGHGAEFVLFRLADDALEDALLTMPITSTGEVVFRLDQISFPPGAIAYTHVHAGPGIRYLLQGSLEVASDHGAPVMGPGEPWVEEANSAVRATAGDTGETAFVRASVLPLEYLGKPSIRYTDPAEDDLPRLQTNTRFFDQVISL